MRIVDIKIEKLRINLKKPFKIAFAVQDYADNVIVKVVTDEGYFGLGEAAPFAPVTGETADGVVETLKLFKSCLIGMDPLNIEGIHTLMNRLIVGNTAAKAAIDIALYDIKGKILSQPLYKVLGGYDNKIQTDMTIGIDTPENMAMEAKQRVNDDGFRILKVKAGINPSEDIKALQLIRKAVGDDIRLRVDANQGYCVNDAIAVLKEFEKIGVEAVEQCLPYWNLDGSKLIREKVNLKVMLDETIHSPMDAAKACKIDAADILNIKLMKCGGLYNALKINAIAEANNVRCMVGCMLESKIAITAGASLVAAKKNITEADCDSFMYCSDPENGMKGGFEIDKDIFTLLDKPGLGIEFDF
ncbi:mandelate racemase/muconate lactonizing enzyme family protein [Romboutsia lituseburensis]|uniref:mandelate racemase/muconate lactonizing enzyme family protein n=1 Tax=Romboutsia lituseburensis TaxID=1537 RepID=UPI00215B393C|nr:dipeptide epimerase [Romboutsia lituseburensis]MCR8746804.1 dipeptide epimerase [Romboutsia lituseburensis]